MNVTIDRENWTTTFDFESMSDVQTLYLGLQAQMKELQSDAQNNHIWALGSEDEFQSNSFEKIASAQRKKASEINTLLKQINEKFHCEEYPYFASCDCFD